MPPTTPLDGGTHPADLADGVRLTAPGVVGTAAADGPSPSPRRRTRGAGPLPPQLDDALWSALRTQDVQTVRTVTVEPSDSAVADGKRRTRSGEPAAAPQTTLTLDVPPPPPGAAQVVLAVDEDGAASWHFPEATPSGASRRTRRGPTPEATQRFTIDSRFVPPGAASPALRRGGRQKRSIVGAVGRMALSTLVYPITDPIVGAVGEQFARRWEERNRPYGVRLFTPEHYGAAGAEPMTRDAWSSLTVGRALLFIHGTFSTAHAAFGALPAPTMRELHARYEGRVFAVNVFTLSADPIENARWILAQIPHGLSLDVDVVCHSRGGLVARALAAEAASGERLRVRRVVFVAAPNAGTQLADPDHMVGMIDRFTSALNIAPSGLVTETFEPIVTAVKVIGHGALKSLTGLAAMNPRGALLKRLNRAGAGPRAEYFAIAADYRPPDRGGLFQLVAERVGDAVVDRVFGEARNDLVVPTLGVGARNGGAGFPFPETSCFAFAAARGVMHTQYFGARETSQHLLSWLTPDATSVQLAEEALDVSKQASAGRAEQVDWMKHWMKYMMISPPEFGFYRGETMEHGRDVTSPAADLPAATSTGGSPTERGGPAFAVRGSGRSTQSVERAEGAKRGVSATRGAPAPRPARTTHEAVKTGRKTTPKHRPTPAGEGTTVTRFPSITSSHVAIPGRAFDIVIDLELQADARTESKGVVLRKLAKDWTEVPIDVRVDSPALTFVRGKDEGTIVVYRNGQSHSCTLSARVRPDAKPNTDGNIMVYATFFHAGRLCGSARRAFPLAARATRGAVAKRPGRAASGGAAVAGAVPGSPARAASHSATQGAATIEMGASAPKLTVVILPPDESGKLYWRLQINDADDVRGLPDRRTEQCSIGKDPAAFAAGLYAQTDKVEPGQHRSLFNGIGEQLYEATPPCFRQAYWALRDKYGKDFAIQFVSGEPYIPWEFIRPVDRVANRAADLLCLDHPVGRWLLDFEGTMTSRLPKGRVVTVAPDYAKRTPRVPPLAAADAEAAMLVAEFKAQRVAPATHDQFLKLLHGDDGGRPVAVLHFAGHGEFDTGAGNGSRVLLSDGDLRVSDVRSFDTQLGRRFGTFVVFNACEVGQGARVLDTIGGWAEAFLHERFGGFVAPLWPAYDEDARVVMQEFFEGAVKDRRPVGEVMRDIRKIHANESPTFLSYMYYGDVLGRFA